MEWQFHRSTRTKSPISFCATEEMPTRFSGSIRDTSILRRNGTSTDGVIAFVDTKRAWIGAAEPLAEESQVGPLLEAFASAAQSQGKRAMCCP